MSLVVFVLIEIFKTLETLERCLGEMLVTHPIRHLSQFVTWSRSQAISIDGYVMSGEYIITICRKQNK